jgi:2-succinyl-5-enolpyruvyl-6-hydroxy-3-cyclohexene-1-carboxylate synthase
MTMNKTKDYIALYRDEDGIVVGSETVNHEVRQWLATIEELKLALYTEMHKVEDYKQLLDETRKITLDLAKKINKGAGQ